MNVSLDKYINIEFASYTLTGDVTINIPSGTGSITFNGSATNSIDGDVTITAPGATVNNNVNISGTATLNGVAFTSYNAKGKHGSIKMNGQGRLNLSGNAKTTTVSVDTNEEVQLAGQIDNVIIRAEDSKVTVNNDGEVGEIEVASAAIGSKVINKGRIITVAAKATGLNVTNNVGATISKVDAKESIALENNGTVDKVEATSGNKVNTSGDGEIKESTEGTVERSIENQLASAKNYQYDPVWEYDESVKFDSNTFSGKYTFAEMTDKNTGDGTTAKATSDLARYLGALKRQVGSTVEKITFDGTEYIWNESSKLVGSNWEKDGVTLVSAIGQAFYTELTKETPNTNPTVEITVEGIKVTIDISVIDIPDMVKPEIVSAQAKRDNEGNIVLTVQAKDENLYSLEVDHSHGNYGKYTVNTAGDGEKANWMLKNKDGEATQLRALPEFHIYASEETPYGNSSSDFESAGLDVTYNAETQTWTLKMKSEGKAMQLINNKEISNGAFEFYLVAKDITGNESGDMNGNYKKVTVDALK